MSKQISVSEQAIVRETDGSSVHSVRDDLAYVRLAIVNAIFIGVPKSASWFLIDAGIPGEAHRIRHAAAERYGDAPPTAIVLTHGHFDHVGSLHALLEHWDVPVYAHSAELPSVNGTRAYSPPDPTVGGGLMAFTSPLFPKGPFDFSHWLRVLPSDGSIPALAGWQWVHTPGHTPGHISLWRAADRSLIAGDAFITTNQESAYAVMRQEAEIHGPPAYYTPDWPSAGASVWRLAALEPEVVITGHGRALQGPEMREGLHRLAENFEAIAVPDHGKYVRP